MFNWRLIMPTSFETALSYEEQVRYLRDTLKQVILDLETVKEQAVKVPGMETHLTEIDEAIVAVNKRIDDLPTGGDVTQEDLDELRTDLEAEIANINQTLTTLAQTVAQHATSITENSSAISNLTQSLGDLDTRTTANTTALNTQGEKVTALEGANEVVIFDNFANPTNPSALLDQIGTFFNKYGFYPRIIGNAGAVTFTGKVAQENAQASIGEAFLSIEWGSQVEGAYFAGAVTYGNLHVSGNPLTWLPLFKGEFYRNNFGSTAYRLRTIYTPQNLTFELIDINTSDANALVMPQQEVNALIDAIAINDAIFAVNRDANFGPDSNRGFAPQPFDIKILLMASPDQATNTGSTHSILRLAQYVGHTPRAIVGSTTKLNTLRNVYFSGVRSSGPNNHANYSLFASTLARGAACTWTKVSG